MNNPHILIQAVSNGFIVTILEQVNQYEEIGKGIKAFMPGHDSMIESQVKEPFQVDPNVSIHETFESVLAFLQKRYL